MKIRAAIFGIALSTHAWAVDYASDGMSYGASMNAGTFDAAKQDPATLLPPFPVTVDQTGLMGDGTMLDPVTTGATVKVTDCKNNAPDPDKYKRQECEAINWWQKNPSIRPQYNITRATDPIVLKAEAIRNDPKTVTGSLPGLSGTYNSCVDTVIPGTKIYGDQFCSESISASPYSCEPYWAVEVDQDFAYKCHQSDYTLNTNTCIRSVIPQLAYTPTPYDVSTTTELAAARRVTNYSWVVKLTGSPLTMILDWIKGGDYIQLWVNGVRAYSNAPYSDVRNTWWGNTPVSNCGSYLYTRTGVKLGYIGSNNCAFTECSTGVTPGIELKDMFHSGYNVIELTCINVSYTNRPCEFSITGDINVPSLDSIASDSGCAVFEERAK